MLLAGLFVIMFVNRRPKLEGVRYIRAIILIMFLLTICQYMENWCIRYEKPIIILYIKSALFYSLTPPSLQMILNVRQSRRFLLTFSNFSSIMKNVIES